MQKEHAATQANAIKKTAGARKPYTSQAMRDRRKRIVDTAHSLLGKGGVAALTIRRLSLEAGVAQRTLYRLFGDKEGVIGATIVDRMKEVHDHIAQRQQIYTLPVVFKELDWMVTEMDRDTEYARVVIGFVFASDNPLPEVDELTSVAKQRFQAWLSLQIDAHHIREDLDLERLTHEHVMHEFLVYRRWALEIINSSQCRLELHSCFLKSAIPMLRPSIQEEYVQRLSDLHNKLKTLDKINSGEAGYAA